jgi:hypothetical protein
MAVMISEWLARSLIIAQGTILLMLGIFVWQISDRAPPFEIMPHAPIQVRAGEWAELRVPVKRDLSRHCDATLDRYIFDANNKRFDIGSNLAFSDAMIRRLESQTPGELLMVLQMPPAISPGPARLVSALDYRCNKAHQLWPISIQHDIHLDIVPDL